MNPSFESHGWKAVIALTFTTLLTVMGCASTIDTERTLAAAGFQMKLADTPEKLAHLQTLQPQHRLVPHSQGGETRYVWADAQYCKCLYAGSQQAYQRYQKLSIEKRHAHQELAAAEGDPMDWGLYGGWGAW